jgi:hypothetical protein
MKRTGFVSLQYFFFWLCFASVFFFLLHFSLPHLLFALVCFRFIISLLLFPYFSFHFASASVFSFLLCLAS